jgi:hypothetical protein
MSNISIDIILKAIESLPSYSSWKQEEWSFYYAFPDHSKDRRLVFKKNHELQSWDLITEYND